MDAAWQTLAHATSKLKPGDTLYLPPGTYAQGLRLSATAGDDAEPVRIRGRGLGHAVIRGPVQIVQARHIEWSG